MDAYVIFHCLGWLFMWCIRLRQKIRQSTQNRTQTRASTEHSNCRLKLHSSGHFRRSCLVCFNVHIACSQRSQNQNTFMVVVVMVVVSYQSNRLFDAQVSSTVGLRFNRRTYFRRAFYCLPLLRRWPVMQPIVAIQWRIYCYRLTYSQFENLSKWCNISFKHLSPTDHISAQPCLPNCVHFGLKGQFIEYYRDKPSIDVAVA